MGNGLSASQKSFWLAFIGGFGAVWALPASQFEKLSYKVSTGIVETEINFKPEYFSEANKDFQTKKKDQIALAGLNSLDQTKDTEWEEFKGMYSGVMEEYKRKEKEWFEKKEETKKNEEPYTKERREYEAIKRLEKPN